MVLQVGRSHSETHCDILMSLALFSFDLEEECSAGCHSLTGQSCLWRQSQTVAGHNYSSCSPPLSSCLDGLCDTFEQLDPSLCPQDCYSPHKGSHQLRPLIFLIKHNKPSLFQSESSEASYPGLGLAGRG